MRVEHLTLLAALTAFVVGFMAFWSNPQRAINRVFLTLSLHTAVWLLSLHSAFFSTDGLLWLRLTTAIGAFFPAHLWMVKEAILHDDRREFARTVWRGHWWIFSCLALAVLCFTEWFVPAHSTKDAPVFGVGYYGHALGVVGLYVWLSRETVMAMRAESGVRKLELQLLLLGGSATALVALALMALRAVLGVPWLVKLPPAIIIAFYAATVVAITTRRIFDARQILLVGLQKFTLVAIVAAAAYVLDAMFGTLLLLPGPFAIFATTAIALWFAASLNGWLDRMFQFYSQATAARSAAFAAARRETRVEDLERAFLAVLKGWGQSDHALVLSGAKDSLSGGGLELAGDSVVVRALQQLRWATPERLVRERATPEREELAQFLREHGLGVLVIGEGPALTAFVGVGVPASRRPFTYPQVTQLMELASIIEGALERAHFSVKAQHAEQLATVGLLGASLAHEIRNPLVTIKTFVQLLPQHHQDAAFRDKFFRLIGDEVGRIDRLTEQLLDLASPRTYAAQMMELHPVLRASLDLVAAKATDKNIQFLTDFRAAPDRAFTDASAAKQVMLNLCFNAIQAVESRAGERWVKVSTRNTAAGLEMAVADSGPGVAAEIRPRLFQPFQTTKSSGFGLGLAICSDILANLNATISVDPPVPAGGATFRVTFPCQPLSS
jgi:signal transduction histidine kinase